MERFVIIVNGFQPLTIITKRSILDVAAALDPPLVDSRDVSASNVIVCTDNRNLNEKGCKGKKIELDKSFKKDKPNHVYRGKLHLNQKGSKILADAFLKEISNMTKIQD